MSRRYRRPAHADEAPLPLRARAENDEAIARPAAASHARYRPPIGRRSLQQSSTMTPSSAFRRPISSPPGVCYRGCARLRDYYRRYFESLSIISDARLAAAATAWPMPLDELPTRAPLPAIARRLTRCRDSFLMRDAVPPGCHFVRPAPPRRATLSEPEYFTPRNDAALVDAD